MGLSLSSLRLHGMRDFGAAEVLVSAWKDDHLEVTGWKGPPFGPAFKESSMFMGVGGNQLPLQDDG